MQPRTRHAKNPGASGFFKMKHIVEVLEHHRSQCHCLACHGSPMGDIPPESMPCDAVVESASDDLQNQGVL